MLRFLIKLAVGFSILGLIVWKIGPQDILTILKSYKIYAFGLINLTTGVAYALAAAGLITLGHTINANLSWAQGAKGIFSSISLSLFLPGRAGDFTLPYFWQKLMRPGECISLLVIDKIVTLIWLLLFSIIGFFFLFKNIALFAILLLCSLCLIILMSLCAIRKTRAIIVQLLPSRLIQYLEGTVQAFGTIKKHGKKQLIMLFFITGMRIFVNGVGFWVSIYGTGVTAPFVLSIFAVACSQLVSILPISIMGLGTVEAVCLFLLQDTNVQAEVLVGAMIVGRAVTLIWLGLFFTLFALNSNYFKKNK